jgi:hypothetical protein
MVGAAWPVADSVQVAGVAAQAVQLAAPDDIGIEFYALQRPGQRRGRPNWYTLGDAGTLGVDDDGQTVLKLRVVFVKITQELL